MNKRRSECQPVGTLADYPRCRLEPPGTPRIYTDEEIMAWAGELGKQAAREAFEKINQLATAKQK